MTLYEWLIIATVLGFVLVLARMLGKGQDFLCEHAHETMAKAVACFLEQKPGYEKAVFRLVGAGDVWPAPLTKLESEHFIGELVREKRSQGGAAT